MKLINRLTIAQNKSGLGSESEDLRFQVRLKALQASHLKPDVTPAKILVKGQEDSTSDCPKSKLGLSLSPIYRPDSVRHLAQSQVFFESRLPNKISRSLPVQIQPHILYAEDDADTRELLQHILHRAGFRVSVTGDSSEVVQLLAANRFDVLLLDNWMPELNGIELCQQVRSFDKSIPIFFCSGAVTEADKKAALSAGAQGYIGKPFDPDELILTLRSALTVPPQ